LGIGAFILNLIQKNTAALVRMFKTLLTLTLGFGVCTASVMIMLGSPKADLAMLKIYLINSVHNNRISTSLNNIFAGFTNTLENLTGASWMFPFNYLHIIIIILALVTMGLTKAIASSWKLVIILAWIGSILLCNLYKPGATEFTWLSWLGLFFIIGFQCFSNFPKIGSLALPLVSIPLCLVLGFSSYLHLTNSGLAFLRGTEKIQNSSQPLLGHFVKQGNISVAKYFCTISQWFLKRQAILVTPENPAVQATNYLQFCQLHPDPFFVSYQNKYYLSYTDVKGYEEILKQIDQMVKNANPTQFLFMFTKSPQTSRPLRQLLARGYRITEIYQEKGTRYHNGGILLTKVI
jgi:hypothetical protein